MRRGVEVVERGVLRVLPDEGNHGLAVCRADSGSLFSVGWISGGRLRLLVFSGYFFSRPNVVSIVLGVPGALDEVAALVDECGGGALVDPDVLDVGGVLGRRKELKKDRWWEY